ncbi:MAG TPA: ABC transporter permease [Ohtaekwangia sp.]|uniref:ABC transporter permease n=1 Tax=Ohtaekwangia sp. TaxID=2066019 RepID=UPI002F95FB98
MSPPRLFLRFFRWYCHPDLKDHIEGDLMELYYERCEGSGKRKADVQFIADVLLLFRPGIIRPVKEYNHVNQYGMIKSYFKIGIRNLLKNKGYSVINIGGLAAGMTVAIIIGLWVYDELSFNRYYENYDRIAQVTKAGNFDGKYYKGQKYLPYPLIEELETSYGSNFKHVVPISGPGGWRGVLSTPEKKITKTGMYIGDEAPEMFTWRMKYGTTTGLKDLHSIMISASTAEAMFGNVDPVGQAMKINNNTDVVVTGVYEDFPKNTEFYGIQFFEPWDFYVEDASWIKDQGWDNHFLFVYVELAPNVTMEQAGANIRKAEMKVIKDIDYMKDELKYDMDILLLPMADWHLFSDFKDGELQSGPVQLVWFIGAIGIFVLLLACINFMNLSTARSEKRAREVGIRKTMGSIRRQLVSQFFSESFLVVALAFVVSVSIVMLMLPWFNELAGKDVSMPWQQSWFWASVGIFIVITGLLAGSYPALYLSSFNPVSILKGTFRASRFSSVPRRILVVIQFTVSVVLIVCTVSIYHQLMYVKDRPVGYSREGLLMIRKKSNDFNTKGDVLRAELKNTGMVTEVAESGGDVTAIWSNNGGFTWEGKDPDLEESFATLNVSPEFGKTVGWHFTEGRDFSADIASDSSAIVLNESAVKYMGLKDPIGKVIHWDNRAWGTNTNFTVVGVINDMVMGSPFEPVKPTIYFTIGYERVLLVKINPAVSVSEALPKIGQVFAKVIPDIPFDYTFADEEYAAKFSTEERVGKLAAVFTCLAIAISCLGLFGLASFVAEQRTKEIGIRKVLGASVISLWRMLSREFVILVILSCIIATPLAYYILYKGLEHYAYRTNIGWWVFATAGLGALSITLLTVSYQAIRAALANPIESLRSE